MARELATGRQEYGASYWAASKALEFDQRARSVLEAAL